MIFFCNVGVPIGTKDFSWVIEGLGSKVELSHYQFLGLSDDGKEELYKIFHTGPDKATGVVANEGFVFNDSLQCDDGFSIAIPWNEVH